MPYRSGRPAREKGPSLRVTGECRGRACPAAVAAYLLKKAERSVPYIRKKVKFEGF